jgi:competence protein ComEC
MRLGIVAFACGIAFLQSRSSLPDVGALAVLVALVTALFLLVVKRVLPGRPIARAMFLVACLLLGFVWAGGRAQLRLADRLPEDWEAKDVRITGVVAALPQRFERGERFEFDVETVHTEGASVPAHIVLSWYHGQNDREENDTTATDSIVHPGERWHLTVRLRRPHGTANPHGFDYEAWLLERGIRATGTVRPRGENQRLADFVTRPAYLVERLRETIRKRFVASLPDAPYVGVLTALAIGDQRSIPVAQWQIFNRTGVTHLVSISGLHVTMVAALFAALANGLWRRSERLMLRLPAQKAAVVAGWLAAFAYASLAGFEVPAQRTLYMLSVVALALWSGRSFGIGRTLLMAMFVVLLLDPWAVLATGFWLSFGAVALLLYVGSARVGERRTEAGVSAESRADWRAAVARWGAAQWAVTIGSLPLLLFFFQQFSLVSPLANAVAIPLVSFLITPLALVFSVLPWPPVLQFDHWLMTQLMALLEWLAGWPVWQQAAPPWWTLPLAVTGMLWMLLPRGFPARWLGLLLLSPALFLAPPEPAPGEAWVDVIDVGQGLAVLVRTSGHALLYDTGPQYGADSDAGQRIVLPFLRAAGVTRLDTLLVSHRDTDHSGGVRALQQGLPIARTLSSITGLGGDTCVAGQSWEWDGVRFRILHPDAGDYRIATKKSNNMSCVLQVGMAADGGRESRLLLTADIEAADEKALIARLADDLRSEVLVVPHHGGRGSSTPAFIAAVGPREAVFSAGYRNAFNHPRPDVMERYAGSRLWRTDLDGAIHVALSGSSAVSAWRRERVRYWHGL